MVPPVYCRKATSSRRELRLVELHAAAGRDRVVEGDRARYRIGRHHFLHPPHHQVDDHALEAEQVAHAADDDMLHRGLGHHLLHGGGEILQHDHRLGAGILELVLELARRVERIDVDDRIARAQHGGGRYRILQHVRHHQRDAGALLQALALQIGRQRQRHLVEVAVADRLVHADEGLAVAELRKAFFQQLDEGSRIGSHRYRRARRPDIA